MITLNNWGEIKLIFGRYKGLDVQSVAEQNPSYVLWADQQVKGFDLSPSVKELCNNRFSSITKTKPIKTYRLGLARNYEERIPY